MEEKVNRHVRKEGARCEEKHFTPLELNACRARGWEPSVKENINLERLPQYDSFTPY